MIRYVYIVFIFFFLFSCKKDYNVQPTYASLASSLKIAGAWAQTQPYYSPHPQIFIDSLSIWKPFISFSFTSDDEPDVIGFQNPYVIGKGTNALYINAMYNNDYYVSRYNVSISSDSGTYNTNIPKCFRFIPKSKDSTDVGTVVVLPQTVTLTRRDKNKTQYTIMIAPSKQSGNYNKKTGVFEIEILFDESNFGGPKEVRRKYRFTS